MNSRVKNIFLWVSVLPAAIVGGFLMTFPLHWILYFTLAHGETISGVNIDPIERLLSPLVIALAFILIGSSIAPDHKFKTAIILTILYLLTFISIFIFMDNSQVEFGMRSIGALVGILLGLFIVCKNHTSTS